MSIFAVSEATLIADEQCRKSLGGKAEHELLWKCSQKREHKSKESCGLELCLEKNYVLVNDIVDSGNRKIEESPMGNLKMPGPSKKVLQAL